MKRIALVALGIWAVSVSGASGGTSVAGNALQFDGDDTVMIPDSAAFDGHTSLTVEMWIRADVPGLGAYLFDQFGASPSNTGEWLMMLSAQSIGQPALTGYFRWPGVDRAAGSQHIDLTDGNWHHVAMARSGPEIYFYIDGKLDVTSRFGGSLSMQSSLPIHLGSRGGFESYWHGEMDEVRFWDHARTPEEIQINLNRLIDPQTPGLIAYWRFDEAVGDQTVSDSASGNHPGSLGNSSAVADDDPERVLSTAPLIGLPGDCNANGVDDADDIAGQTSEDCNSNGVPDSCDLIGRISVDLNTNGLPDECDVPGDLDNDGDVDFGDFTVLLAAYGSSIGDEDYNLLIDFNGDGVIGILDYQFWLEAYRSYVGNAQASPPLGLRGDSDFDQDIDLADYMILQFCVSSPPEAVLPCTISFDFNGDNRVDILDLAEFTGTVSGP